MKGKRYTTEDKIRILRRQIGVRKASRTFAGNQGQSLVQIGTQFIRRPRFARVAAGNRKAATQFTADALKTSHIIPLPAMKRDGNGSQLF